jgi:hypothetical protein
MRSSLLRSIPVLLAGVLAAACADAPTGSETGQTPGQTAELGFSLNLSGTDVRLLTVDVMAPDITQPMVYNVEVAGGTATGRIDVPAGPQRTIRVRAYDVQRVQTHEGSATMDVKPGNNPPLAVTLLPAPGKVPLTVNFGSLVVNVRAVDGPNTPTGEYTAGTSMRFEATVTTAAGVPVPGAAVRWATANPGVATVDEHGMATAHNEGITEIVATYNGHGAAILVPVTARTDFDPPAVTSMWFDSAQVTTLPGISRTVRLGVRLQDGGSGVDYATVVVRGVNNPWSWTCSPLPTPVPGEYACYLFVGTSSPPDDYVVTVLEATDYASNRSVYSRESLAAMGIAPRFTVIRG